MTKIFISYRREDSQWPVDRLRVALAPHVDNPKEDIFVDIDNIPVGADFVAHIDAQVGECDVLLAVIGPAWLGIRDKAGARRLDDPKDFVRVEIGSALRRGIPVAPVLIEDTAFPPIDDLPEDLRPLARRNGAKLRRESFDQDVQRLIAGLKLPKARARRLGWVIPAFVTAAVIAGVAAVLIVNPFASPPRTAAADPSRDSPAAAPAPAPETGPARATAAGSPQPSVRVVFDFDRIDTSRPPSYEVAAAPALHAGAIPIDVAAQSPASSHIVIRNNLGFYDGRALKPTVSQNFLTQVETGQADCSFTLSFGKPVRAVTFTIPAIFPASPSGVTFPAWRATALGADGAVLGDVSAALARRNADEPAHDYTLRTPNFEPIASVRFDSDYRLDGTPFAAFAAIVIERIELEPMT